MKDEQVSKVLSTLKDEQVSKVLSTLKDEQVSKVLSTLKDEQVPIVFSHLPERTKRLVQSAIQDQCKIVSFTNAKFADVKEVCGVKFHQIGPRDVWTLEVLQADVTPWLEEGRQMYQSVWSRRKETSRRTLVDLVFLDLLEKLRVESESALIAFAEERLEYRNEDIRKGLRGSADYLIGYATKGKSFMGTPALKLLSKYGY